MPTPCRRAVLPCLAIFLVTESLTGCRSQPQTTERKVVATDAPSSNPAGSLQNVESAAPEYSLKLPQDYRRHTGDWEEIKKSGVLRLLVLYNKTGFFYDRGRPRGMIPEFANELESYLNKKLRTGARKFKVAFISD